MIRAGISDEANPHSGVWVFVDLGFAKKDKSCGLLIGDGQPQQITFSQLRTRLLEIVASDNRPLNLLLEAPLSVAFNEHENPTGRKVEKRENKTRYWYVGPGCSVLIAATYLLRAVHDANSRREIRLFEGLVSFKQRDNLSSHSDDVTKLRSVIWSGDSESGQIFFAKDLTDDPKHRLISAFLVAGMDFGIPPVVVVN